MSTDTRRTVVAVVPPGITIDAALAAMNGMAGVYRKESLSLGNDDRTGGMLILHDPDARPAPADEKPAVTVELGGEEPGDLFAYAMSVAGDDHEQGLKMMVLALAAMLENAGAANYLTFSVALPDIGAYAVTIQRVGGKTPAGRIAELEQQPAEATGARG